MLLLYDVGSEMVVHFVSSLPVVIPEVFCIFAADLTQFRVLQKWAATPMFHHWHHAENGMFRQAGCNSFLSVCLAVAEQKAGSS
jgi:sterol desaturase/sphingolipid hydroxylase (fatty acid hydroxylase superfamily)